jgi:hypothetical protein
MGRLAAGPSLGWPPEFDPEQESIEKAEAMPGLRSHGGYRCLCCTGPTQWQGQGISAPYLLHHSRVLRINRRRRRSSS